MSDKVMPANTLREELREAILESAEIADWQRRAELVQEDGKWAMVVDRAVDLILFAIKNRLPKEKDSDDSKRYTAQDKPSAEWGYNTCLQDVKQALDIESEGASNG